MRKQDRIANQQQNRPQQPQEKQATSQPSGERIKGGASDQPMKPQRQGGKLPLPD